MEQKKTLWIVLAAGIFLLFVIGAALVLYAPQTEKSAESGYSNGSDSIYVAPSVPYSEPPSSFYDETTEFTGIEPGAFPYDSETIDGTEPVTQENEQSIEESVTTDSLTVYANGTTNIYGSAGKESEEVTAGNEAAERIIRETGKVRTVPEKTILPPENQTLSTDLQFGTASVSSSRAGNSAASVGTASDSKTSSASSGKSTAKESSSKTGNTSSASSSASSKASSSVSHSASTVAKEKEADRFWIQVASYTSKKKADEARQLLYDNGLECEVFTWRNKDDTLFFRVRVGPYTTKSEAEFWKKAILAHPDFASSGAYVTNSSLGK
ncbi:SPOR domain-containing protein [Treponema sp.]|uniref:SPOR domain-containing protein n=1 Tax=Treponema sp. TaxID=166 RepID=UPI0025D0B698|nr:SPOR domain-containing protein [Treponema sp.]MCR5217936.1 SPOR domain-containing protein [Treponema sp.]